MVYIYALLGRLILYPYLMYRSSRLLSETVARRVYWYLIIELGLSTLSLLLHNFVMHPLMSLIMTVSLFIFFSTGYATAFLLGVDGLRYAVACLAPGLKVSDRLRAMGEGVVVLSALGVFALTMVIGYRNVAEPRIVYRSASYEIYAPEERRWTASDLAPLRMVLITDLHIGEGITPSYVERIIDMALSASPDVILVGGDYIDHYSRYAYTPEVMAIMRRLHAGAPLGAYYVTGNHEYRADSIAKLDWVAEVGGTLLVDSVVALRGGVIRLVGRDDYVHRYDRKALAELAPREQFPRSIDILLDHTPEELDSLAGSSIRLALYGHTHGGQLFPNHLATWLRYGVTSGAYEGYGADVYVSSGAGSAGAPYRIGTRSEIVVYDIVPRLVKTPAEANSNNVSP